MYHVSKVHNTQRTRVQGAIIPLANIRQSCMLIPIFINDESEWQSWTPENVLDSASSFLVNNWASKYSYETIW
jgi:hypothetical protein